MNAISVQSLYSLFTSSLCCHLRPVPQRLKLDKEKTETEKEKAEREKAKVLELQERVQAEAQDAQNDLAAAEPAIMAAMAALDTLDRKDLGMCKTMANPPPG